MVPWSTSRKLVEFLGVEDVSEVGVLLGKVELLLFLSDSDLCRLALERADVRHSFLSFDELDLLVLHGEAFFHGVDAVDLEFVDGFHVTFFGATREGELASDEVNERVVSRVHQSRPRKMSCLPPRRATCMVRSSTWDCPSASSMVMRTWT